MAHHDAIVVHINVQHVKRPRARDAYTASLPDRVPMNSRVRTQNFSGRGDDLARAGQTTEALQQSEDILRRRRNVKFGDPNNFDIKTADKFIEQFDSITAMIGLVAIAISSLGLLVGGIGVMNIMLVSVTERTKEIGVRKALGARRKDIVRQFLFEAMTLTFLGGILGVIIAVGISKLIMLFVPSLPASIPTWAVVSGLTVSVGVGLLFGVWPARKASRLDPIECLRYE